MMYVLITLAERRLWRMIAEVLRRNDKYSTHEWVVTKEDGDNILTYALYYLPSDQLDSVLTTLVERRLWWAVGEVLKRGVSDSKRQWAVSEAFQHADDDTFAKYILPRCSVPVLIPSDDVRQAVQKEDWNTITRMWRFCQMSDKDTVLAIESVCTHRNDEGIRVYHTDTAKYLLAHCPKNQLGCVLTTLTKQHLWRAVYEVLKRDVSDSLRQWAVSEACQHADDHDINNYILPRCADDQLDSVLKILVERRLWRAVGVVLKRGVSDSKRQWAVSEACQHADEKDLLDYIQLRCADNQLYCEISTLVERRLWDVVVQVLQRLVRDTLFTWAVDHDQTEPDDEAFWNLTESCYSNMKLLPISLWRVGLSSLLESKLDWDSPLYTVLCEAILELLKDTMLQGRGTDKENKASSSAEHAQCLFDEVHQDILVHQDVISNPPVSLLLWIHRLCQLHEHSTVTWRPFCVFHFIKYVIQHCYNRRKWKAYTDAMLMIVTCVPLFPGLQTVALRVLLHYRRFDVISCARLSCVWEQDRRRLFHAAVKQRQWSAVKRWADHTLYDDQRVWALQEAFQDQQWDIYLQLTDYGLTEDERIIAQCRVARYADWEIVCRMFETVADVRDIRELLTNVSTRKKRSQSEVESHLRRTIDVLKLETNLLKKTKTLRTLKTAVEQREWCVVMYIINHKPDIRELLTTVSTRKKKTQSELETHVQNLLDVSLEVGLQKKTKILKKLKTAMNREDWRVYVCRICDKLSRQRERYALKAAVASEAWHVVMQLLRLETDVTRRDSLFRRMVRRRQWGVCRALLEQGVSQQLCLKTLPQMMEQDQWTLVAMVMEDNVDDDIRRQVMQQAMEVREGSVVWQCISKLQSPLTVEEREVLFQHAFNLEIWQAVKPLIEEKDSTGIRHRDTALLEAIEQHQWDAVDHCQRQHADINMQDDKGDTPIHRDAREGDWEAVDELTVRDGDPSLLDSKGMSVMHRAIDKDQWGTVKLLITFQGDIHQKDIHRLTPLQMLINARQGELIDSTLMWLPDQGKGVNNKGETTLHAVCLSDKLNTMYYLVARGANPLAMTKRGHSALSYAVLNRHCPQKMVAECITLGFSTHQPQISGSALKLGQHFADRRLASPLLLAVLRGLPVVTQMLYESGSCSYTQLFSLCNILSKQLELSSKFEDEALFVHSLHGSGNPPSYVIDQKSVQSSADFLRKVSMSPHSLQSTCRLVISRCLTLSKHRHRHVAQLPVLDEAMKNYVAFSDLTDPDYVGSVDQNDTDGTQDSACRLLNTTETDDIHGDSEVCSLLNTTEPDGSRDECCVIKTKSCPCCILC